MAGGMPPGSGGFPFFSGELDGDLLSFGRGLDLDLQVDAALPDTQCEPGLSLTRFDVGDAPKRFDDPVRQAGARGGQLRLPVLGGHLRLSVLSRGDGDLAGVAVDAVERGEGEP
ncbi:MAG: hypothetical protein MI743_14535, partial [Sneathiellales bacterium]|nr:hypothetical protein [Sneathiellales bacterium]